MAFEHILSEVDQKVLQNMFKRFGNEGEKKK